MDCEVVSIQTEIRLQKLTPKALQGCQKLNEVYNSELTVCNCINF